MQSSDYILGSLLILAVLCGVCGNIIVIYSILKERRLLKSNYYYLVLNLAVFDALHLLAALRLNYMIWFQTWLLTHTVACKIWVYFEILVSTCGIEIMVIICIFRYRAVLHPLKPPISRRKLRLLPLILFVAVSVYLIPYIAAVKHSPLKGCHKEWPNKTFWLIYTVFSMNVDYILPVAVMSVLYYKICKALIHQARKMNSLLQNGTGPRGQESLVETQEHFERIRHNRNTRTFLVSAVSVGIFTLVVLPFQIWWVCDVNGLRLLKNDYAGWFYVLYMVGSSSVNPFIYGVLDKKLVDSFKRSVVKKKQPGGLKNQVDIKEPVDIKERVNIPTSA